MIQSSRDASQDSIIADARVKTEDAAFLRTAAPRDQAAVDLTAMHLDSDSDAGAPRPNLQKML